MKLNKLSTTLLLTTTLSSLFIASPSMANDNPATDREVPYIFDVAAKGGNNRTFAQVGGFIPMYGSENDLVFSDVRFMRHLVGSKKKSTDGMRLYNKDTYEANIGLGYRYAYKEDLILGGAAYYDTRRSTIKNTMLSQMTFNLHFITPMWQTDVNAYVPVGKKKVSVHKDEFTGKAKAKNHDVYFVNNHTEKEERTTTGGDLHVMATIPGYEKFSLGPVIYHFKGKKAFTGGGIEMKWDVHENVSIEADYTYDKVRKSNFMVGVRFSIASSKLSQTSKKKRLMSRRVKRDVDAVTESTATSTSIDIFQPNKIALSSEDLTKLDSSNSNDIINNVELVERLTTIKNNKNGEIIVANGTFTYNEAVKTDSGKFKSDVNNAKKTFNNSNKTTDQLNTECSKQKNTLIRASEALAIQENHRTNNNKEKNQYRFGSKNITNYKHNHKALRQAMYNIHVKNHSKNDYSDDVAIANLPGKGIVSIERAGVMTVAKDANGNYITTLGKNSSGSYEWFSGKVSKADKKKHYLAANREGFEETRGQLTFSQLAMKQLENQGCFIYNSNTKTYVLVYPDVDNSYTAAKLNAVSTNNLPASFKEMNSYKDVSLNQFTNAINTGNRQIDPSTKIQSKYFNTLKNIKTQATAAINKAKNLLY
ncbi:MAG: hypothetical protein HRU35_04140 [Rickettsiaceae bacterium]|nr:hypothetical protein [Rickettsiaceae bacterium]